MKVIFRSKKRNRILETLLFLGIISFLTSCDPSIGYEYYLNNNSDKELRVYYLGNPYRDTAKTIMVLPKTNILLFRDGKMDKNPHDEGVDFLKIFDTISFSVVDSSKLIVDYLKRENWTYSNHLNNSIFFKTGTNIYKLEILNEYFENKNKN